MTCELCGRSVEALTTHHLVPIQKDGRDGPTAELCSACHRQVHSLFDNATLARQLNTLEKLRADDRVQKFVRWVRKQSPNRRIKVRRAAR